MTIDVGVGQLVEELEQRGDRLPFEIGAFVALEACEGLIQQAVKLEADDVRVTLEGSVIVAPSAERAEPDEAARSLVSVLSKLLVAAGPGVPPYLLQLVRESVTGEAQRDLRHLHDAIEASLIPINRGASRRVLARLVRDSDRPPAPEEAGIDPHELDAELDELLREPASRSLETRQETVPPAEPDEEEVVTARITIPEAVKATAKESVTESVPVPAPAIESALASGGLVVSAEPVLTPEPDDEAVTATIRVRFPEAEPESAEVPIGEIDASSGAVAEAAPRESVVGRESTAAPVRPSLPQPPKRRPSLVPWLLVFGVAIGGYGLWATGVLDRFAGSAPSTAPNAPVQSGAIDVTVAPADSQIFVFVGRGPAVVEGLSLAGPHEFVVFDRGLEPARAVVPEDGSWVTTSEGALYELAVQARPSDGSSEPLGLGAPQTEPASLDGPTGTVRVITNPPGTKVYRFVGLGPKAEIRAASIQEGQEILVYHPGHSVRREVVGPSDWRVTSTTNGQTGQGDHTASIDVALLPLPSAGVADPPEN